VKLIRLSDFEDSELLKAKSTRNFVEYLWTLTPSLPLYVLRQEPQIDMVSYIDADCFLFGDLQPVFDELSDDSVMIIEPRYSKEYEFMEPTSGKYNVGMLTFRNDKFGLEALQWWRARCNEWCYYRQEDGKLGDQMYLNDWPMRFQKVHVLAHKGACVAPWNIRQYETRANGDGVFIDEQPLIFYHFHALKMFSRRSFDLATNYQFSRAEQKLIYKPYLAALVRSMDAIRKVAPGFSYGLSQKPPLKTRLKAVLKRIR
jgi:hypothetical protein